jgi:predicted dehydrogenase
VLKVAILGFGFIGRAHGEAYARLPNVKLVTIGGCREERVREWKAPGPIHFYADPDVLLKSADVDIVDICLPTFMHEEFVTKAAAMGMHVICEKPLALTVESADRMLDAVR